MFTSRKKIEKVLQGIRVTINGPVKKAKRKKKYHYHFWVSDYLLTGQMSLQRFSVNIDYYHSDVRLKRATLGVRVWLFLDFVKKVS